MRKFEELKKILHGHNNESLSKLPGLEVTEEQRTQEIYASVSAPVKLDRLVGSICPNLCDCDCYCGSTKNTVNASKLIDECLNLEDKNSRKCRVAMGSVLDEYTQLELSELPVVLAVGVNYGQGNAYARTSSKLVDNTKTLDRTKEVFHKLETAGCSGHVTLQAQRFHLVNSNFFPWITQRSWSQLNAIEEAFLLNCAGHADPVEHILELIRRIKPEVIIFHGANNIVPFLGAQVIAKASTDLGDSSVIYSDNLALWRGQNVSQKIYNAVVLCRQNGRETMPHNYDE